MKAILLTLIVMAIFPSWGRAADNFAVFLPSDTVGTIGVKSEALQSIKLRKNPIISTDDIEYYSKGNHEIRLKAPAIARIMKVRSGTPFVVCVGSDRIYVGAFWAQWISAVYDGVMLLIPMDAKNTIVHLSLGYPTKKYFSGKDPRSDPRILRALEASGKLR